MADEEKTTPRRTRRGRSKDSAPEGSGPEDSGPEDSGPGQDAPGQDTPEQDTPEQDAAAVRDEGGESAEGRGSSPDGDAQEPDEQEHDDDQQGGAVPAAVAARRAARYVADFTGRRPESVVSVERRDGDWQVGVEVTETHRIPDTSDVLAIYEVCLDGGGRLLSYRRKRRYARGQLDKECR